MKGVADDPSLLFARAASLVDEQLLPGATETDRSGAFPVDNMTAIAQMGLFGMAVPSAAAGLGLSPAEIRAMLRLISSGCGATAFAFAQHHGTVGAVASTPNIELRERWLPRMLTETLGGTAFAHVRRSGPPILRATADGGGWRLDGSAPWVTSWGHAEIMSVAALTDDGRIVWSLLPAVEGNGISVSRRFDLVVFQATSTVALHFDGTAVSGDDVLSIVDRESWAARDRLLAARPSPLCLGIGDRASIELTRAGLPQADPWSSWFDGEAAASEAQCVLVDQALVDDAPSDGPADLVASTARRRADTLLAVQKLTTALLAAAGGSAMDRSHPAQRLAREAMFYVVQAQSSDGRTATLDQLAPDQSTS